MLQLTLLGKRADYICCQVQPSVISYSQMEAYNYQGTALRDEDLLGRYQDTLELDQVWVLL